MTGADATKGGVDGTIHQSACMDGSSAVFFLSGCSPACDQGAVGPQRRLSRTIAQDDSFQYRDRLCRQERARPVSEPSTVSAPSSTSVSNTAIPPADGFSGLHLRTTARLNYLKARLLTDRTEKSGKFLYCKSSAPPRFGASSHRRIAPAVLSPIHAGVPLFRASGYVPLFGKNRPGLPPWLFQRSERNPPVDYLENVRQNHQCQRQSAECPRYR